MSVDPIVLTFYVDPTTGEISMAQYRAVNHGSDQPDASYPDEVANLAGNVLSVKLIAIDGDGDADSYSVDLGYNAETIVSSGLEALRTISEQKPDIVLMDMQMPRMGGLDATIAIRAFEAGKRHTPIVAMTANAMEVDRAACMDAGMDAFLSKPFDQRKLLALIDQVSSRTVAI